MHNIKTFHATNVDINEIYILYMYQIFVR